MSKEKNKEDIIKQKIRNFLSKCSDNVLGDIDDLIASEHLHRKGIKYYDN